MSAVDASNVGVVTKQLQYFRPHRHATWLELFFDLVFVASIGVVTHNLAHTHDGHVTFQQLLLFPVEFIPIWWIWATHTLYANRFDTDGKPHRLATLAIMFLMVTMAAFMGENLRENYASFIGFYVAIRVILAGLYLSSVEKHEDGAAFARYVGLTILVGAGVSAAALLFDSPTTEVVFLVGILAEMIISVYVGRRFADLPVHRSHLVERAGLLAIILLGESVISLVAGLRGIEWNEANVTAATTGFLMVGSIWWIYFDSFNMLERATRIGRGNLLIYSQLLFVMGLLILANLIRHSILGDLNMHDFRLLAITGMVLLYIGKQTLYFVVFPPYRINIVINSAVCIGITALASFLPRPDYALVGMTLGMFFYSYSNLRWTLPKDVSPYLVPETDVTGESLDTS